jgi:nitrite reductase/ring-hydroxylating ferredoxin subunit
MLHGTQVNISDETRVALTMRINPKVPRFNDDAPFNAEHWYASTDLAKRRYTRVSVFPANEYQGDPSVAQEPVPPGTLPRVSAEKAESGDIVLCSAVELDKSGQIAVDLGNRKLLLVKDENGTRAFNRRCPHRGIDLADGHIDGQEAFCPGHGIAFSLSDGKSSCAALHLVRLDVIERDGQIVLPAKRDKGPAAEGAPLADG